MPEKTKQERDDEALLKDSQKDLGPQSGTALAAASAGALSTGAAAGFANSVSPKSAKTLLGMRINAPKSYGALAKTAAKYGPKGAAGSALRGVGGGFIRGQAGTLIDMMSKDTEEDTAKKVVRFAKMNGDKISFDEALKMVQEAGDPYKNLDGGAVLGYSPTSLLGDKVRGASDFVFGGNNITDQGTYGSDRAILESTTGTGGLIARLINNRIESYGYDAFAKSLADVHHSNKALKGVGEQATRNMLRALGWDPAAEYGGFGSEKKFEEMVELAKDMAKDKFPMAFDPNFDPKKRKMKADGTPVRKYEDIPMPEDEPLPVAKEESSTERAMRMFAEDEATPLDQRYSLDELAFRRDQLSSDLGRREDLIANGYSPEHADRHIADARAELDQVQAAIDSGSALPFDEFQARQSQQTDERRANYEAREAAKQAELVRRQGFYPNYSTSYESMAPDAIRGMDSQQIQYAIDDNNPHSTFEEPEIQFAADTSSPHSGSAGPTGPTGEAGAPGPSSGSTAPFTNPEAARQAYLKLDPERRWMIKDAPDDLRSKDIEEYLTRAYGAENTEQKNYMRGQLMSGVRTGGGMSMSRAEYDADTAYRANPKYSLKNGVYTPNGVQQPAQQPVAKKPVGPQDVAANAKAPDYVAQRYAGMTPDAMRTEYLNDVLKRRMGYSSEPMDEQLALFGKSQGMNEGKMNEALSRHYAGVQANNPYAQVPKEQLNGRDQGMANAQRLLSAGLIRSDQMPMVAEPSWSGGNAKRLAATEYTGFYDSRQRQMMEGVDAAYGAVQGAKKIGGSIADSVRGLFGRKNTSQMPTENEYTLDQARGAIDVAKDMTMPMRRMQLNLPDAGSSWDPPFVQPSRKDFGIRLNKEISEIPAPFSRDMRRLLNFPSPR